MKRENKRSWQCCPHPDPLPKGEGKECDPDGIRTRVAGVKGLCPRPLDDGAKQDSSVYLSGEVASRASGALTEHYPTSRRKPSDERLRLPALFLALSRHTCPHLRRGNGPAATERAGGN